MTRYDKQKQNFIKNANLFILTDDLVSLSKTILTGLTILLENKCLEVLWVVSGKKKSKGSFLDIFKGL